MSLRKLYQWVGKTSKDWNGVTRHFRENVRVFSRAVVRSQSSQVRKVAGATEGRAASQRRRLQRFMKQEQPMSAFFEAWTRSVVKAVKPQQVVLAVDETKLEEAFRDLKSHGWQLEQADLTDPLRITHLWIFLVVAYAWMLLLGAALSAHGLTASLKRKADGSFVRRWSLFRQGRQAVLLASFPL